MDLFYEIAITIEDYDGATKSKLQNKFEYFTKHSVLLCFVFKVLVDCRVEMCSFP